MKYDRQKETNRPGVVVKSNRVETIQEKQAMSYFTSKGSRVSVGATLFLRGHSFGLPT